MDTFFRSSHGDLTRRAARIAGDAAEDIVQDLYVRMLEGKFDRYPSEDWRPIAMVSVSRSAISYVRSAPVRRRADDVGELNIEPVEESFDGRVADRVDVDRFIDESTPTLRPLLEDLRGGLGRAEAADRHGLSRGQYRTRIAPLRSSRRVAGASV